MSYTLLRAQASYSQKLVSTVVAMDSRFRGNDVDLMAMDSRFRGNDVDLMAVDSRFRGNDVNSRE